MIGDMKQLTSMKSLISFIILFMAIVVIDTTREVDMETGKDEMIVRHCWQKSDSSLIWVDTKNHKDMPTDCFRVPERDFKCYPTKDIIHRQGWSKNGKSNRKDEKTN